MDCWGRHRLDYLWPEVRSILRHMPTHHAYGETAPATRDERVEFLFKTLDNLLAHRTEFAQLPTDDQKKLEQVDSAVRETVRVSIRHLRELIAQNAAEPRQSLIAQRDRMHP